MVTIETLGIPEVAFVAEDFVKDYQSSALSVGLPEIPVVRIPSPYTGFTDDETREDVDKRIDEIIAALTTPVEAGEGPILQYVSTQAGYDTRAWGTVELGPVEEEIIKFTGNDYDEAYENLQKKFLDWGWGDGLPLVPATRERVDAMLAGTSHAPDEVVVEHFPTAEAKATVEKIAINAVMAGARPEYLPVILAAADAWLLNPKALTCAQSTTYHAPFFWVNGPIIKELGINYYMGALGPGSQSRVNIAIGRAFRLLMMNVGGLYVGIKDMDTIGGPQKFSMVVAENEEANPWEPYHVEKGFDPQVSTISHECIGDISEIPDLTSIHPEVLLTGAIPGFVTPEMSGHFHQKFGPITLLTKDHAEIFSKAGWTKDDIRNWLGEHVTIPREIAEVQALDADDLRPLLEAMPPGPLRMLDPKDLTILVVGAEAGKSIILHRKTRELPAPTVVIDKWR